MLNLFSSGLKPNAQPIYLSWFFSFYKKYINERKDEIIEYIENLIKDEEYNGSFSTSIYGFNYFNIDFFSHIVFGVIKV